MLANDGIDIKRSQVIKDSAFMPGLHLSPFLPLSAQTATSSGGVGNEIEIQNENTSLFARQQEDDVADVGLDSLAQGD
jgi:hypothetical protein